MDPINKGKKETTPHKLVADAGNVYIGGVINEYSLQNLGMSSPDFNQIPYH